MSVPISLQQSYYAHRFFPRFVEFHQRNAPNVPLSRITINPADVSAVFQRFGQAVVVVGSEVFELVEDYDAVMDVLQDGSSS